MEFRLTYQGVLLAETQRGQLARARADHKHSIRRALHPQLQRLWEVTPVLAEALTGPGHGSKFGAFKPEHTVAGLAGRFNQVPGYNFVPLIHRDLLVACSLEVLFLRSDPPGNVLNAGDIDNRLKTLFDGLRMPKEIGELGGAAREPAENERPFYCLLEDDALITKATIETDTLLDPNPGPNDARVIITVRTKLLRPRHFNLAFA